MRTPLLLFLLSSSVAWATVQPRGEFRGYTEVNRILKERVARANGFQLGKYLGESSAEPGSNGLLSLLGTYLGSDTDAAYRNGQPNSLNMLLWYLALSGLASEIGQQCLAGTLHGTPHSTEDEFSPLPEFARMLKPLCAWPLGAAKTDPVLYGYWVSLMSFDAPYEEFLEWKTYFVSDPEFARASAEKAVAGLTLAAFYNPYFLLRN